MLFFRKLVLFLSSIFLFLLSVFSLLISINENTNTWIRAEFNTVFLFVYQELTVRIITQTISILLLLLCLGVFFAALKLRRRDKTYKLESPYGEIKVSVGAIEDYIKMIKTEIAGVKDLSPKVFLRKGKVKIYVRMSLYADSEIGDVVVSVQSAIKSYLSNILLEEKIGAIRVFVSNIIYRDKTVEEHRRRRN